MNPIVLHKDLNEKGYQIRVTWDRRLDHIHAFHIEVEATDVDSDDLTDVLSGLKNFIRVVQHDTKGSHYVSFENSGDIA